MFLRLQNGTTLKAQEKRNAYHGNMRDFVKSLVQHPFFAKVGFANSRYAYDLMAAQMVCLEINGGPANIKNTDLNRMYKAQKEFDINGQEAKAVLRKLNILDNMFKEKTPELERYNVISLYCMIAEIDGQYVLSEIKDNLLDWFLGFETKRRTQEETPEDQADPEWMAYKDKISHSNDAEDSIRGRMEFMLRHLLKSLPSLSRKDNQREFTHVQKLTIFRRDKSICQLKLKCNGNKVSWDDWHCDHIHPWSKGGKTTVENGQVSCSLCNLSKNNNT